MSSSPSTALPISFSSSLSSITEKCRKPRGRLESPSGHKNMEKSTRIQHSQDIHLPHVAVHFVLGLASNTINIIVFAKIGFRDNVTVTLLFLSLSDLLNLILKCPMTVMRFMEKNFPNHDWPFDRQILYLGVFWYAYVFYDYSSFISVFLALVRCVCIARPLRFKSMFTTSRTVIILVILFLMALTFRAPVLTIFRLSWIVNPLTNSTYRSIRIAPNFREIYKANDIFNRNIVSWVAYITTTTCVIILGSKLQAASRFRQSLQITAHAKATEFEKSTLQIDKTKTGKNPPTKTSNNLSVKDLQVIQSITLVCVIFILSQLPFQVMSTIRLLDPEFGDGRKKMYAYGFTSHISATFGYLNSSINIFVYYHFNTRYRETFLSLLFKRPAKV
ncbi:hypothetical protein RRG08_042261 [Elysia crispata]|uniref:G-protein coupled receptors family 1 profile domain-containing protein n=1 Tax=Elysia crispata TaxID=231223 RepID=A0AAE1E3R1_9GAST|nr:hypothetical protein RRG08_042261 [Elysia crispata]